MSTRPETGPTDLRINLALVTLFLCTFTLGTAELGVVGMLDLITADLGVSISTTGSLVTAYALGIALGGPILAALTIRLPRRALLLSTLGLYIVLTLLIAVIPNFATFAVARVLAGSVHGLFVGVAFTVAVTVAPPAKVGKAISAVIGGFAVSVAFGVPLGSLIGQALGWRQSFFAMVAVGVVCLVLALVLIPRIPHTEAAGLSDQTRFAFAPRVLALLALAILIFAGQYATFTYITPYLQQVTGISGGLLSAFLLAYGVATAVGVFGGGRFAAQSAARTLIIALTVVVLSLVGLYFVGPVPVLVALVLVVWGVFGLGLVPSLQFRIVSLAGPGKDLAATLPASAINAGIAIGALAGGWAAASFPISAVVVVGAVICLVALPVAWATSFLKPPPEDTSTEVAASDPVPARSAAQKSG